MSANIKKVKNDRYSCEIPTLLSCKREKLENVKFCAASNKSILTLAIFQKGSKLTGHMGDT